MSNPKTKSSSPNKKLKFDFCTMLIDEVFDLIAQFSSPTDSYNLALTCKRFHQPTTIQSSSEFSQRGGNSVNAVLATRLLRTSLLTSLERILRQGKLGLTSNGFKTFLDLTRRLPRRNAVVISGSTMVQCVLGEYWDDSDVDIFCSAQAAPEVRTWFIKELNQLFVGGPIGSYDGILTDTFLNTIHHVEHYIHCPQEGAKNPHPGAGEQPPPGIPIIPLLFSRDEACRKGERVNEDIAKRIERRPHVTGEEDYNNPESAYCIKTLDGTAFPYDDDYEWVKGKWQEERAGKIIDFVVGKDEFLSAQDLLESFDLDICKCNFNGDTFTIPDPHRTFARKTVMGSDKLRKFLSGYHKHFDSETANTIKSRPSKKRDRYRLIRKALKRVKFEGILLPSPLYGKDSGMRDSFRCQQNMALHNYACREVKRLKKYKSRGIIIEDPPIDIENKWIRFIGGGNFTFGEFA